MRMSKKPLTEKQLKFCQEYLKDFNGTRAYKASGYTAKNDKTACAGASRLLSSVNVQQYLSKLKRQKIDRMEEKALVTVEEVIRDFQEIKRRCMQAEPVMQKQDGELVETGEYKFDSSGANKANEMLGKHLGIFKDKIEHSGHMSVEEFIRKTKEK